MWRPSRPGSAATAARERVRDGARLLRGLLAHQRAPDDRRARDPEGLRGHRRALRLHEREPGDVVAPVRRERRERPAEQVRRPDAVARVAEGRPGREPADADDRRPVRGGDVDRPAPGVRDRPALELREHPHQVALDLRDHARVDLHPPARPRARGHPPAGPAEEDAVVARGPQVVQQRAAVGDRLAAAPAQLVEHVGHRLGHHDVARGDGQAVAQRRQRPEAALMASTAVAARTPPRSVRTSTPPGAGAIARALDPSKSRAPRASSRSRSPKREPGGMDVRRVRAVHAAAEHGGVAARAGLLRRLRDHASRRRWPRPSGRPAPAPSRRPARRRWR